mmetsp:Transcript_34535/g.103201  ORF Transcript_34535/g.103201 Transcript_34535/m.103201 type:complete len:209 (-) Transcript_34535:814-1440(-)
MPCIGLGLRLLEFPEEGHCGVPVAGAARHSQLAPMARRLALPPDQGHGLHAGALLANKLVGGSPVDAGLACGALPQEGAVRVAGVGRDCRPGRARADVCLLTAPLPLRCRPSGLGTAAVVGQGHGAHVALGGGGRVRCAYVVDAGASLAVRQARALPLRLLPERGAAIAQSRSGHRLHGPRRGLWPVLEEAQLWRNLAGDMTRLHRGK